MSENQLDTEVLIVGAGPTGLVLTLWLARAGIRVRVVDRAPVPAAESRALGIQARTLEYYRQLGIADEVVRRGQRFAAVNLWVRGRHAARVRFGDVGAGLSRYPYMLVFPQDEHEALLIEELRRLGVVVERPVELADATETSGGVLARLLRPGTADATVRARYLIGCDGARSRIRQLVGAEFPGGTYERLFYVADVSASGPIINGELNASFADSDFLAVFPMRGEGHGRFIGVMERDPAPTGPALEWSDVSRRIFETLRINVTGVNWFSTYRVHHRVASRWRAGRMFLAGDAAHVHSPVGGQGMNTGIGDAVNLAWKLADVLRGRRGVDLLDTYEPERIAFARRLVATTDRVFVVATSTGAIARLVRTELLPRLLPPLFSLRSIRRFLFRTISQTAITYRGSPLSSGAAGALHGGDRLPWIPLTDDPEGRADNFAPLETREWQTHVYGGTGVPAGDLPLQQFRWEARMARAGIRRAARYLVRPDGHIASIDAP